MSIRNTLFTTVFVLASLGAAHAEVIARPRKCH